MMFFITSLIGFFSYIYLSLFFFVLCGLVFLLDHIFYKQKFIVTLKKFSIPLLLFCLWSGLMLYMDSQGNLRNTQHISNSIDIKFFLITLFYVLLNFLNFYFSKSSTIKINSIMIIIVLVSCNFCFYSTLITGVDLGGNDHFYYFANPFQWITFFNIYYNFINKINIKLSKIIVTGLVLLQFLGINNYSTKYIKQNKVNLLKQIEYTNNLEKIKNIIQKEIIISLDPLYVWYGLNLTNSYSFIPNHLDLSVSSDEIIEKFLISSKIFELSEEDMIKYFFKKPSISKRSINFEEIVFAGDLNDEIYDALKIKNLNKKGLIEYMKKIYKSTKANYKNNYLFLINKEWHLPNKNFINKSKTIFENEKILILKIKI